MVFVPGQKPASGTQTAIQQTQRQAGQAGQAGTYQLAPLTTGGSPGLLTFNSEGRLVAAKAAT